MANNCKCKTCGLEYHCCSNCDCYEDVWYDQYNYCCENCARSGSHIKLKEKIVNFIKSLTVDQRTLFMDIMESDDTEVYDIISNDLMGRLGIEAWEYW